MPYEFLAHTGDIAVEVWADSLADLFAESARAFAAALTDVARVEARESCLVTCEAGELDVLLHDFLSDLVFQFDTRRWLPAEARVTLVRAEHHWRLDAQLRGEPYCEHRHPLQALIKAVTYHQLAVTPLAAGWEATIVFDI